MVGSAIIRAEALRIMFRLTQGVPRVSPQELLGQPLRPAERRLLLAAGDEELALLNALLELEAEQTEHEFAALERLLFYAQFNDGPLDNRLRALPRRAFADAANCLYALGWVGPR